MPRLPDTFGARPTPRFSGTVASNRYAGAPGRALAGFGQDLARTADRMLEKEDRMNFAAAKAAYLKADIAARNELQNDQDWQTWEKRYGEKMASARAEAAKLITSSADRGLFETDIAVDRERGIGEVRRMARGREVSAGKAALDQRIADLQDVGQGALDDGTRLATLHTASELIDGARLKGYLSDEEAGEAQRRFGQDYTRQGILTLHQRGELEAARALFERSRGQLDAQAELAIEGTLSGAEENRTALIAADTILRDMAAGGAPPSIPSDKAGTSPPPTIAGAPGTVAGVLSTKLSPAVVAGFLGNFDVEGGYGGARGDGGKAVGIAQWHPDRQANFRRVIGKPVGQASHAEQARFVLWEMDNPGAAGMSVAGRDAILRARTPEQAAALIDQHYERSSGAHRGKRVAAARRYAGGIPSGEGGSVTAIPNVGDAYARVDAMAAEQGWAIEQAEKVKEQVSVGINRMRAAENQARDESYERAYAKVEALGEGFTDPSQLGPDYFNASPEQRRSLDNLAEANLRAQQGIEDARREAKAERVADGLELLAIDDPDRFKGIDLRLYAGQLLPAKLQSLRLKQAKLRNPGADEPKAANMRSGITAAINWGVKDGGSSLRSKERIAVYNYMESVLTEVQGRGKSLTQQDFTDAFRLAVQTAKGGDEPNYELLTGDAIPQSFRDEFMRDWKGGPRQPRESEIVTAWRQRVMRRRR